MLITQFANMQVRIGQYLISGDPYFTFLKCKCGVLNISRFTIVLYTVGWQIDLVLCQLLIDAAYDNKTFES